MPANRLRPREIMIAGMRKNGNENDATQSDANQQFANHMPCAAHDGDNSPLAPAVAQPLVVFRQIFLPQIHIGRLVTDDPSPPPQLLHQNGSERVHQPYPRAGAACAGEQPTEFEKNVQATSQESPFWRGVKAAGQDAAGMRTPVAKALHQAVQPGVNIRRLLFEEMSRSKKGRAA